MTDVTTPVALVERLRKQVGDDHVRGCQGREYACSCGYDLTTEGLLEIAADRIEALETALRKARTSITAIAAECHRAKWEFDLNEDYTPSKTAARAIIQQAFSVLHRIGDIAIKAKDAALDEDDGK